MDGENEIETRGVGGTPENGGDSVNAGNAVDSDNTGHAEQVGHTENIERAENGSDSRSGGRGKHFEPDGRIILGSDAEPVEEVEACETAEQADGVMALAEPAENIAAVPEAAEQAETPQTGAPAEIEQGERIAEEILAEVAGTAEKNDENSVKTDKADGSGRSKKSPKPKKPSFDWAGTAEKIGSYAAAAGNCAKKVGAGLTDFLAKTGRNACDIIKAAAYSSAKAVGTGGKASAKRFREVCGTVLPFAVLTLADVGGTAWRVVCYILRTVCGLVWSFLSAVFGTVAGWITKKLKQPLLELWCFIITPFAHAWGGASKAWTRFINAFERGPRHVVGAMFHAVWDFLGGIVKIIRFSFNYIAPALSLMFLIGLIRYASTLQYAITVTYNGSDIGTIENEATYKEAETLIQDKVTFTENESPILVTPTFSVTVVNMDESEKQPTDDIDELSETMIERGDVEIVYAYGLYINGELYGVYSTEDMETIRAALEKRLNGYSRVDAINVAFEDEIMFTEGRFIKDVLASPDGALELINGGVDVEAYYSVQKGDSIDKICENLGITRDDFAKYNPGVEKVSRGDIVTYHYTEPYLNVLTTYYEAYDQVIERTTEYVETSRREQYCEILLQHGSDGYENVTALVTLKNGVESDRTVVSRTILEEMVPRKFRVGTKENTYLDGDTTIIDKLGTFCWPLGDEDCYISTMPGWRSWDHSNHMALDIAGIPRGTPIYAACDGKVTFSGRSGAYGELVIVDCGSGYECYYAHCSKLLVEEGDRVEKGDTIAEVGMTGSASGNHLHFEMRHNGDRINPLMALGGTGGHEIRE